jgi:hypothetical protein
MWHIAGILYGVYIWSRTTECTLMSPRKLNGGPYKPRLAVFPLLLGCTYTSFQINPCGSTIVNSFRPISFSLLTLNGKDNPISIGFHENSDNVDWLYTTNSQTQCSSQTLNGLMPASMLKKLRSLPLVFVTTQYAQCPLENLTAHNES